jgi:hypothetical protein
VLREITQSPYLNLLSGLILLVTSAYEIIISIDESHFGISHGILVFSIIQIIKVIPEMMHGLTDVQEARDFSKDKITRT